MTVVADTALASALLESDRVYFELGARVEALAGADLAWVPGLEEAPAACVVHRVDEKATGADPHRWVTDMVGRLAELRCSVARVYLHGPAPPLEQALAQAGFRRRVEIGYLWRGPLAPGRPDVTLRPVVTDADWEAKHQVHAGAAGGSDGHRLPGASWVELERRKCGSGRMHAYLVEVDGTPCGSIAELHVDGLLRAKNVFVHPAWRRQGVGAAAMGCVSARAVAGGGRGTGIFGVEGKPGNALYRRLGMAPAVEQYEWSRPLQPANRGAPAV